MTRNRPCECGSGKRFKHCHGQLTQLAFVASTLNPLSPVRERERERQQGRGRAIVSFDLEDGRRGVAVHSTLFAGPWKTFADFLLHYIKVRLGEAWGTAELKKPEPVRHPLLQWYGELCRQQVASKTGHPDEISSAPAYGVWGAYLGLAYDLYTAEHAGFAKQQPEEFHRLLARLRHVDQFNGARFELKCAGFFLRAGFTLAWEKEAGRGSRVGEFLATWPASARTFWVECRSSQSGRNSGRFQRRLADALRKPSAYERIVLIDLNRPGQVRSEANDWRINVVNQLRILEQAPSSRLLPPAFVILTNFPDRHHLGEAVPDAGAVLEGFNMQHHRLGPQSIAAVLEERERYPEIEALMSSMREHTDIPSTFDGSIPGLDPVDRLIIGRAYRMDDGFTGVLTDVVVMEPTREAVLSIHDGHSRRLYRSPMSDDEFRAWQRYPDTFFGRLEGSKRSADDPVQLYDFLLETYRTTSREKLLEFMTSWPDRTRREQMSHAELAKHYCLALANSAAERANAAVPTHIARMRPIGVRQDEA